MSAAATAARHVRCCDCGESGSTLRFLVPVLAALGQSAVFTGKGRLPQRPMEPMLTRLREHGVQIALPTGGETLPLELTGQLQSGDFVFAGDISSQYITGLLFALPLLQGDSRILLSSLSLPGTSARSTSPACCLPSRFYRVTAASCSPPRFSPRGTWI